MSKRLILLIMMFLLLAVSAVAYAEDEPVFVLTEEQINAEFTIPSTATRRISNLEVDVKSDGVYISFEMTTRNGTTTTNHIIAILIGFLHGDFSTFETNLQSSSLPLTGYEQRQITNAVARAWRNSYFNGTQGDEVGLYVVITDENGIYFYAN